MPAAYPRSYSTAYVARRLGISIPTVQRWVDSGDLVAWKTPGGHRRIDADSADQLFRERAKSAAPAPQSVIVVDDNPDDRDLLVALVESVLPDARVDVYDNAVQALVAIGARAPDILISDIVMPNMNGLEMLRQLTTRCPVRPRRIVVVTSLQPQQLARLGGLPDGVVLVRKPIQAEAFGQALLSPA